jgi:adenylate cyclase
VALLVLALLQALAGGALHALEERTGDLTWRLGAEQADERRVVIIDIDERSLREVGPWPWPRPPRPR